MSKTRLLLLLLAVGLLTPSVLGMFQSYQEQYHRAVEVAPAEEDIGDGYQTPPVQRVRPRSIWLEALDITLLVFAMGLGAWIVLVKRRRQWLLLLTLACLGYFGFYREGCVCPIGAIQNVSVSLVSPQYAVSFSVIAFFILPLMLALFFGRVFCGGVCPLGALQEVMLLSPVQVPRLLDRILGSLKYIYLGLAIMVAIRPDVVREFLICRFDPFVGFFRGEGPANMLMIGGAFLVLGMFVGRPFCRYLCPYGALLAIVSRFSWRGVSITPDRELDCGLCKEACPYGAIENMRAIKSSCLFCARCFQACPRHRATTGDSASISCRSCEENP